MNRLIYLFAGIGCLCRTSRQRSLLVLVTISIAAIVKMYHYLQQNKRPDDQYMPFVIKAEPKKLQNPLIHKHKYQYIFNNETVCRNGNRVFLLIYVLSARENKAPRDIIRHTWGSVKVCYGKHVHVKFLTGQKNDGYESSLKKENDEYGDIIEGTFKDTYENLTYKSVMGLHWVNNFCNQTRFVMKTDDDVVVNIYKLVHFLIEVDSNTRAASEFLYCNVEGRGRGVAPIRRNESKFYMNATDYRYDLYPPYCHGPGYVFSFDVAARLLESTRKVPFFKFEDVFIGFCTTTAGLEPQHSVFGFYIDISNDDWKPFHWTILKHLGTKFLTNATQYEQFPIQNSIIYNKLLRLSSISAVALLTVMSILCIFWCVPWLYRKVFRSSFLTICHLFHNFSSLCVVWNKYAH